MRIQLFDYVDEAQKCLKEKGRDYLLAKDLIVVSLGPKVEAFLKKEKIPCQNTIEFFDTESHRFVVDKTEEVMQFLQKHIHFEDALGLRKTYDLYFLFHVKFYVGCFLTYLEILHNIRRKHAVTEIHCYGHPKFVKGNPVWPESERFLGEIVKRFAELNHIKVYYDVLSDEPQKSSAKWYEGMILNVLKGYFGVYEKIGFKSAASDQFVLVPTWGYRFDNLIKNIRREMPKAKIGLVMNDSGHFKRKIRLGLMSLPRFLMRQPNMDLFDAVFSTDLLSGQVATKNNWDEEFKKIADVIKQDHRLFSAHSIFFGDLVVQKITVGLKPFLEKINRDVQVLGRIYDQLKPKLIVSPYSAGFYYAMGELAEKKGIESCIITHGTHVPPNNRHEDIENFWLAKGVVLNDYRTVAVQSPWAEKFLNFYNDNRKRLYTGPLIFSYKNGSSQTTLKEKFVGKENANKKLVLYATTQRSRYTHRFYITETLDEFVSSISDLIRAIDGLSNVHILIRPHPSCRLSTEEFGYLLPKSRQYTIGTEGSFQDMLSSADCLVSYSSTCIEEALANAIPVVLYDKWNRYKHFPSDTLRPNAGGITDPVVYLTGTAALQEYFKDFAKSPKAPVFDEKILDEYRYPWEDNRKFYDYVSRTLTGRDGR